MQYADSPASWKLIESKMTFVILIVIRPVLKIRKPLKRPL